MEKKYPEKYTRQNTSSNNIKAPKTAKITLVDDPSELTKVLCTCLESKQFNVNSAVTIIKALKAKKLIYSEISNHLFVTSKDNVANFLSNIELLKDQITNSQDANYKEIEHIVYKLYDHTQLANHQISVFKIGKEELDNQLKNSEFISSKLGTLSAKVDNTINTVNSKFEDTVEAINSKFDDKTELISSKVDTKIESVNSQVISLVALFTAMSFLVFGGLSSFESIFSNIQETSLLKLIVLSSVWGLAIINTIGIFMFFTSKVVGKSFSKSSSEKDTLYNRYPYITLGNYVLLLIFSASSLLYLYIKQYGYTWPQSLNQCKFFIILSISILLIFLFSGYFVFIKKKKTKTSEER